MLIEQQLSTRCVDWNWRRGRGFGHWFIASCVVSFADGAATAAEGGAESINCARRRRAANNPCNTLSLLLDGVVLFGRCRTHTDIIYDVSFRFHFLHGCSGRRWRIDISLTVVLRYYYYNITTALALIKDAFQPAVVRWSSVIVWIRRDGM
jgi:hypothetical protein